MADGIFRSKNGYTVVQNTISRDRTISMKAKGLYLIIQSYITMPDKKWLKSDFMRMVPEGEKSFNSAWKELKLTGYLKTHVTSHGTDFSYEYELLDEPALGHHTFFYNSKGILTKAIGGESKQKDESGDIVQNEITEVEQTDILENDNIFRYSQNGHVGKGCVGKGSVGNGHADNGDDGNGNVGHGNVGKGDDNNNAFNNNSSEINPLISNSFIHREPVQTTVDNSSETTTEDERTNEIQTNVILDLDKKLLAGDRMVILDEMAEENGIPYEYANSVKDMTIAIQCLSEWNNYEIEYGDNHFTIAAYKVIIESLIEMATSKTLMDIKDAKVSYANVIDKINILYRNASFPDVALTQMIRYVIDRFREATIEKKIRNYKGYIRSIIWEALSVSEVDWESFFNRTYYGGME